MDKLKNLYKENYSFRYMNSPISTESVIEATPSVQPKKRIIIGVPGSSFTNNFLIAWTRALYALWESSKYEVIVAPGVSSFVTFARMKTLGVDVLRGKDQKPFNDMAFDVYITLDSDIVFSPEQLIELIDNLTIHPVVAGYYMMSDCKSLAIVKDWNTEFFAKTGSFEFLTPEYVATWKKETGSKFMPVSYVGMGFFAVTKEALNTLKYPFFNSELQRITKEDGTELVDICSEDVSFCKNLQAAGYTVYVNTELRVGHEKQIII
jgi:hypothetical protein